MDLTLLTVFREVARLGSFTAAGSSLGYTQSAVSRQISALEHELGAVLFDRLARGVRLTEEGRSLLPHAEAVLDRLGAARADLAALRDLAAGRLRVGSSRAPTRPWYRLRWPSSTRRTRRSPSRSRKAWSVSMSPACTRATSTWRWSSRRADGASTGSR